MISYRIFRELYLFSFLDLGAPLENSNQALFETFKNQQNIDQELGIPLEIHSLNSLTICNREINQICILAFDARMRKIFRKDAKFLTNVLVIFGGFRQSLV